MEKHMSRLPFCSLFVASAVFLSGCCCPAAPPDTRTPEQKEADREEAAEKAEVRKAKRAAKGKAAREKEVASAVKIGSVTLAKEYDANEVKADNRYKDKDLIVSGRVVGIEKDFLDNIVVHMKGKNMFLPVQATMKDTEKDRAANLDKGDQVTVFCRGAGAILNAPLLKDCTFR
jgi:hypothetical protein